MSLYELYIFQVNSGLEPFYVNINNLVELFNTKITMSYDSNSKLMSVYSDGKQITTDYLMDRDVNPTGYSFGSFISYTINNETVKVIGKPAIGIQERLINTYLKNTCLEAEIRFEYDSNSKIIGFDLGEVTAVSITDDSNSYTP